MTRKRTFATAVTLLLAVMVAIGAISASASTSSAAKGGGNLLAGAWTVTVNRPAPLPPLQSLQVFSTKGGVVEMANEAQASRTPAFGTWERIEGHLYAATAVFFRFDATGAYVGKQKINRTILIAPDGQTFTHVAQVTVYNAAGVAVTSFVVRAAGERMQVERIPDLP